LKKISAICNIYRIYQTTVGSTYYTSMTAFGDLLQLYVWHSDCSIVFSRVFSNNRIWYLWNDWWCYSIFTAV